MNDWSSLLEVYGIEEILERSDLTKEEVLDLLWETGMLKLPEVTPLGLAS